MVGVTDKALSEDKDESTTNALLVGAGVAVAAGAVTAGIMAGSSESEDTAAAAGGTPSSSMPRYMQYRWLLYTSYAADE